MTSKILEDALEAWLAGQPDPPKHAKHRIATCLDVAKEMNRADEAHGRHYASAHEAESVLREEMDEFWDEVKKKKRNPGRMYEELIQVAAVACRYASQLLEEHDV